MPAAPIPGNEPARLAALQSLCVLDSAPEPEFDRLTELAADLLRVPIAAVSLVDAKRQWFKASVGLDIRETPREQAFCAYTVFSDEVMIVEDASRDPRFQENPLVTGLPGIRFYAGAPLIGPDGARVGSLCVIDVRPRRFSLRRQRILRALASIASVSLRNRQMAMEGKEASRAKSIFLASMSHEIRTPMNAVLGNVELLRDPTTTSDEWFASVDSIDRNARHLLELINNILDFSKIEAGKLECHIAPVRPADIVEEVRGMFESSCHAKGVTFEASFSGDAEQAWQTDALRVRQMLVNLVGNAVKFTDSGRVTLRGRVDVGTDAKARLELIVSDTGPGMSAEQADRLFRAFEQVDTQPTGAQSGTGLGLAISQSLANLLGGDIRVTSAPGQGSQFSISLPVRPVEAPAATPNMETFELPLDLNLSSRRILLVDDGVDNQRLMRMFLTKAGAQVTQASDGQQAVQIALDQPMDFDVIFMDVQMPVLDGLEATARLRSAGYGSPIIALTAFASEDDRERCLSAGCDDFLTKPIERDKLVNAASRWSRRLSRFRTSA